MTSQTPAPDPTHAGTHPSPMRANVERFSRPILIRLKAIPRWLIPILTLGVLAVAVLAPVPIGMVALALVFVWMTWLAYLSWPVVTGGGRLMRIGVLIMLVVIAWVRISSVG